MARRWLLLAMAAYCATCGGVDTRVPLSRFAVQGLQAAGLSGSTRDDRGVIWAVSERRHQLFRFASADDSSGRGRILEVAGIDRGLELESMAWLDGRTLAIGTEADWPRSADAVLLTRIGGGEARVVGRWWLPWSLWSADDAPPNAGIEGLCSAGPFVVAGGEPVILSGGARWAPIARMRRDGLAPGEWTPYRLRLTTAAGKLASLDCWLDEDELEVYAIERHYGVGRVLQFDLPTRGTGGDVHPSVAVDLATLVRDLPNLEGLTHRGDELVIITDHDPGDPGGTTETIVLGPLDDD